MYTELEHLLAFLELYAQRTNRKDLLATTRLAQGGRPDAIAAIVDHVLPAVDRVPDLTP